MFRHIQMPSVKIRLSILGKEITPVHVAKDLGVTFDSNLTFHQHIVKTVSSCFSSLAQINRVKHVFDRSTLIKTINTLVFSKLFYCRSSVWSSAANTNLLKLQAELRSSDFMQYQKIRPRYSAAKGTALAPC